MYFSHLFRCKHPSWCFFDAIFHFFESLSLFYVSASQNDQKIVKRRIAALSVFSVNFILWDMLWYKQKIMAFPTQGRKNLFDHEWHKPKNEERAQTAPFLCFVICERKGYTHQSLYCLYYIKLHRKNQWIHTMKISEANFFAPDILLNPFLYCNSAF